MTNRYWSLALAALSLMALPVDAQINPVRPEAQQKEAEAFASALRDIEADPFDTESVETFLRDYPASQYAADAQLAYEKAQLITGRSYSSLSGVSPLKLHQIRPSRQYLESFYDGQQQLDDLIDGKEVDLKSLQNRYARLASDGDDNYKHEAQYYAGYCAYAQKNFDEAEKYFSQLDKDEKYEPAVTYYRMQMAYLKGDTDNAMLLANQLQRDSKKSLTETQQNELTRLEAECLMAKGQNSQAKEKFAEYLNKTDEAHIVPVSAYNAAILAANANDQEMLTRALPLAVRTSDPQARQQAYFLLGMTYVNSQDYAKARLAFNQAARVEGGDENLTELARYNVLSCVHQTTQSPWGDEVTMLEQFLNDYPNSAYRSNVSNYLTDTYKTTTNYGDALNSIANIKNPTPAIIQAKQRLLTQMGMMSFVNANYPEAISAFDQSIALGGMDKKSYEQALYWRGESYYQQQQYDKTAEDMLAFNKLNTTDHELQALAYYTFAYTRMNQSQWDNAITNFNRYFAVPGQHDSTRDTDAKFRQGECYYYKRDFEKAESCFNEAEHLTGDSNAAARALYQAAMLKGIQKKYTEKQKKLDELIEHYPASEWVDDAALESGRNYTLQLKYAAAIEKFKFVIANYPESESARKAQLEIAMAYNNLGDTDKALAAYKRVIEQYAGTEEAQTAANDLKAIYVDRKDINGYADYAQKMKLDDQLSVGQRDSLNLEAANSLLSEGNEHAALQRYQELLSTTGNEAIRREILFPALQLAHKEGDHAIVIQDYNQMQSLGGFNNAQLTEAKLRAAQACIAQGSSETGLELLTEAGADMRTAAGAEARYRVAEFYFQQGELDKSDKAIDEMLNTTSPHRDWMLRAGVLRADVMEAQGKPEDAKEFLQAILALGDIPEDILTQINSRLNK